jgi:GDSL-like Lipase/Acylhydrolase family
MEPLKLMIGIAIGLVLFGVAGEIILRLAFGFGNPPLYLADDRIGYLLAPNQRTRRFGNRIEVNQYSMRSAAIAPSPPDSTLRVLLLGDSLANGGWWTDQPDTIAMMLARSLQERLKLPQKNWTAVEVLNASANSWGPRNELAYLQRFGAFRSQAVVLLINTDDLFAIAPNSVQVGRDRNYPERRPLLAWIELFQRYVLPAPTLPELEKLQQEGGDRVGNNLAAIGQIQALLNQENIPLAIAMTPLLREVGKPGPKDYELKARQRLLEFTQSQNIPYLDFLPLFNTNSDPQALYRDTIHLTPEGNRLVSEQLSELLGGLQDKLD